MALFAAWGTGRTRALLVGGLPSQRGVWGWCSEVPSSAHPFSHLATFLLSLPPARLLIRWGQVPQGGQHRREQMGTGAEPWEEGQGGETSAAWRGQPENCLTF